MISAEVSLGSLLSALAADALVIGVQAVVVVADDDPYAGVVLPM